MWGTVYSLARILLPLLFVIEGIGQIANNAGFATMLLTSNMPLPVQFDPFGISRFVILAYLVSAIEVLCGLMVMFGYRTRAAAFVLVIFTIGTIMFVHPFWLLEGKLRALEFTQALKNISIIAGLLIIAALGPGRYSLDGRRRRG